MSWAKVGRKCVCIDDQPWKGYLQEKFPIHIGRTYEIASVFWHSWGSHSGIAVTLVGVKRDVPFSVTRFRPLVTKTQSEDVAMFKRIADQVPNMEDVG